MTPFKVICVDDSQKSSTSISPPLIKNKIYVVYGEKKCECGRLLYDIGIDRDEKITFMCTYCRNASFPNIWWCYASRFRRIDEYPDATSEILKDFNPDKVEQEICNPQKVEV